MNRSRYETVICQIDRTTGELIVPERSLGIIASIRNHFERAALGLFAAGIIATLFAYNPIERAHPATAPTAAPTAPPTENLAARKNSPPPLPSDTQVEKRTRVGSRIRHRFSGRTLVIYSEPVYETRVLLSTAEIASKEGAESDQRINLNTASLEEIERSFEGVGPIMANRIIDARPFAKIEDLRKVSGIGPKRYERIARQVTVE